MRLSLVPHPAAPCAAVEAIDVTVTRLPGARLHLEYVLTGNLAALALPDAGEPARADELWKHTCFEAFIRPLGGARYVELNLAPSRQWAAYAFDDVRTGMRNAEMTAPAIDLGARSGRHFHLRATADLGHTHGAATDWRLALSAVIEETNGAKSYWALAHPDSKPDFHHSGSFVAGLPGV